MLIIQRTLNRVKPYLNTLTAQQYDFYKSAEAPSSRTLENRSGKSWNQILYEIGLPIPPDRQALARASNKLHLIEKEIINRLGVGWNESTFYVKKKVFKPDSSYIDKVYHGDKQLLILDVKLCICSSYITIYKYLPIFQEHTRQKQLTFFTDWIGDIPDVETITTDNEGQQSFFGNNNILYIAYLTGKPIKNIAAGGHIIINSDRKRKRLPGDMEVRFINFMDIAKLYCQISDIAFDAWKVQDLLDEAQGIKEEITGIR
jgi:hypothetical protein